MQDNQFKILYNEYAKYETVRWKKQVPTWESDNFIDEKLELNGAADTEKELKTAVDYFLENFATNQKKYDAFIAEELMKIQSVKQFIRLQFIIRLLTYKEAKWEVVSPSFVHINHLYIQHHIKEPYLISPFWYLLEQLIDDYVWQVSEEDTRIIPEINKLFDLQFNGKWHNIISLLIKCIHLLYSNFKFDDIRPTLNKISHHFNLDVAEVAKEILAEES